MTITYNTGKAAIQYRCLGYMLYARPLQLISILAPPFVFGYMYMLDHGQVNPAKNWSMALLFPLGFYAFYTAMVVIQVALRTRTGSRICTTTLYPQGIMDVLPGTQKLTMWREINEVRCHNGDVYVWASAGGSFIPVEAFKSLYEAQAFADAISAARQGDFSKLEDPNQPGQPSVVTEVPKGVWPPPPM